MPGFPFLHYLLSFRSLLKLMAMMPSKQLILCCPLLPLPYLSQHQGLFQWVDSSHQVDKVLDLQLQYQSFQWQGWFPLRLTGLISSLSKGLSEAFSSTTVQKHQFFSAQSSLWSLSRFVIAFLPSRKCLLISWLQLPSAVILEPKKTKSVTASIFLPIYLPWSDGTECQNIKEQRSICQQRSIYGFSRSHVWMWGMDHEKRLSAKELMVLNCSAGEDSWVSLDCKRDQTSQS